MPLKANLCRLARQIVREIQRRKIPPEAAGVGEKEDVRVVLPVLRGVGLGELALADARDAGEEHRAVLFERRVQGVEVCFSAAEPRARARRLVEHVPAHERRARAGGEQIRLSHIPRLKRALHPEHQELREPLRRVFRRLAGIAGGELGFLALRDRRVLDQQVVHLPQRHVRVGQLRDDRIAQRRGQPRLVILVDLVIRDDLRAQLYEAVERAVQLPHVRMDVLCFQTPKQQRIGKLHLAQKPSLGRLAAQNLRDRRKVQTLHRKNLLSVLIPFCTKRRAKRWTGLK